jgi:hypothetical protein
VLSLSLSLKVKQRVGDYIKEANQFYNSLGINLIFETQFQPVRSCLVINILPQQQPYDTYANAPTTVASAYTPAEYHSVNV